MTRKPYNKTEDRRIERAISESYRRTCSGVQVDIMDIGEIFRAGRAAIVAGHDLDAAIIAFVQTIRKN
jgi:hypothetical protein